MSCLPACVSRDSLASFLELPSTTWTTIYSSDFCQRRPTTNFCSNRNHSSFAPSQPRRHDARGDHGPARQLELRHQHRLQPVALGLAAGQRKDGLQYQDQQQSRERGGHHDDGWPRVGAECLAVTAAWKLDAFADADNWLMDNYMDMDNIEQASSAGKSNARLRRYRQRAQRRASRGRSRPHHLYPGRPGRWMDTASESDAARLMRMYLRSSLSSIVRTRTSASASSPSSDHHSKALLLQTSSSSARGSRRTTSPVTSSTLERILPTRRNCVNSWRQSTARITGASSTQIWLVASGIHQAP